MGNVFDEMGQVWAEIADQNHAEEQIQFLKPQLKADGKLLDLACGTARHLIPLSEAGFEVVGLDVSLHLLRIARQRGAQTLVRGDLRFLPFRDGSFCAAISVDTSFGYLTTEADDAKSLLEAKRVLIKGGELVLDVFNRERLVSKYRGDVPTITREYPSFVLEQKRSVSPNGERLRDIWAVKDSATGETSVFTHSVRLYRRSTLEGLIVTAGFTVDAVFGGYTKEPYTCDASRLIFVASAC